MLAACVTLYLLRDLDTLWVVPVRTHGQAPIR